MARTLPGMMGGVVFTVIGAVLLIFSVAGGRGVLYAAGVCFALAAMCAWFALSKRTTRVLFDEQAITLNGRRYAIEHVNSIGYDAPGAAVVYGAGAAIGTAAGALAGSSVYMVYGSERIPLIRGLNAQNVEQVYHQIVGFLGRFGHKFG